MFIALRYGHKYIFSAVHPHLRQMPVTRQANGKHLSMYSTMVLEKLPKEEQI